MMIQFPWWLSVIALGLVGWPAVLSVAIVSGALAVCLRRRRAWFLGFVMLTVLLLADCAGALYFFSQRATDEARLDAEFAKTHSVLAAPRTIDGMTLPAGTAVSWTDDTRAHVWKADLPGPTRVLGVLMDGQISDELGEWLVMLPSAQVIGGWSCSADLARFTRNGRLRMCTTSADYLWQGRLIPARTMMGYSWSDVAMPLVLPAGRSMTFPEIPLVIGGTASLALNPDGALARTYIEPETPFVVDGIALWNNIEWHYPDKSRASDIAGAGRPDPISVSGALVKSVSRNGRVYPANTTVLISLPDGGAISTN